MWFNILQHLLAIADGLFVTLQAAAVNSRISFSYALWRQQDSEPRPIFRWPTETLLEERQVSFHGLNGQHEEPLSVHDKMVCITWPLPRSARRPLTKHESQAQ